MAQPRKIGFRTSHDDIEVEPMQQINTTEESEEESNSTVMLEDYIPGAVYDGQGNIVTYKSFNAKIKKLKAEARNLNWTALARLILYTSLGASILLLSYGTYKKYFNTKNDLNKAKTELINSRER
jgi:hypothetical protein